MTSIHCSASFRQAFGWLPLAAAALGIALLLASTALWVPAAGTRIATTGWRADSTGGARFGGRIATVLRRPVPVQYVTPPLNLRPLFDQMGYRLERVRRYGSVPRLFLASLPADLLKIKEPRERKVLFLKTALPLILHANEMILWDRRNILGLVEKLRVGKTITARDQGWLDRKSREYGLEKTDLAELVRRVDAIPPSLALAQAAEESGWGTSRFAHEGNAIFGQRRWRGAGDMIPQRRPEGQKFKVRAFSRLIDGVMSYTRNLNSHPAYEDFRRAREAARRAGRRLDGHRLAETLTRYSERGPAYVETIQKLIRVNELRPFDAARLSDGQLAGWDAPGA